MSNTINNVVVTPNGKTISEEDVLLYLSHKLQLKENELNDVKAKAQEALEFLAGCEKIIEAGKRMRAEREEREYILKNLWTVTAIAKLYGYRASTLNNILATLGIQYKVKDAYYGYWRIAKQYEECGYVIYKGTQMYWTPKGKDFIEGVLAKKVLKNM